MYTLTFLSLSVFQFFITIMYVPTVPAAVPTVPAAVPTVPTVPAAVRRASTKPRASAPTFSEPPTSTRPSQTFAGSSFTGVIATTLLEHDYRSVELEFRIGTSRAGRFSSCVGHPRWTRLVEALTDKMGDPIATKSRERIVKNGDGSSSRYDELTKMWTHKKRMGIDDVTTASTGTAIGSGWSVRACASLEYTDSTRSAPVSWQHTREKDRVSFRAGAWTIDLTKVKSSPPTDIDGDVTYEVEIELADVTEFFSREIPEILARGRAVAVDMIEFMTSPTA